MKLPSKELLSEVFGFKVISVHNVNAENDIHFNGGNEEKYPYFLIEPTTINIYELAHKCKEWAKSRHFIDIDSHLSCARWGAEATSHNGRPSVFYEQVFIGRTEPEAIFKACEWIMGRTK